MVTTTVSSCGKKMALAVLGNAHYGNQTNEFINEAPALEAAVTIVTYTIISIQTISPIYCTVERQYNMR